MVAFAVANDEIRQQPSPNLQPFAPLLDAQPHEVQEASELLLATAMHEAGRFELLNLAGGFPAKRTLLVMAISRCQKTSHQFGPRNTRKATKGAKCFRVFRAVSRRSCSRPPCTTTGGFDNEVHHLPQY
jgi:hypothetical protein